MAATALETQFQNLLEDGTRAVPVAAIQVLLGVIERSSAATMHGLDEELREARDRLLAFCEARPACLRGRTVVSVSSGSELFLRHATRTFLEFQDFDLAKTELVKRGAHFAARAEASRGRIAALGREFVADGGTVLVHGRSRVVLALLAHAAETARFSVLVTEGRPDAAGYAAAQELRDAGVPARVVLDAAVAAHLETCDAVVVGAEAVVENGGVINRVGTLTVAACARAFGKPVYVAAESYKFARLFPLNQADLPESHAPPVAVKAPAGFTEEVVAPACDYTPPEYIALLFTDLGVLTPAAVSDELVKLYQ